LLLDDGNAESHRHVLTLENEKQLRENQRLQANLERSEFKYREFFEPLDEIVLVLQPTSKPADNWVCVDANAAALCAANADRQAIVGVDLKNLPQNFGPLIQRERLATALTTHPPRWYETVAGSRQYRLIVFAIGAGQVATAAPWM
jgi:hypothetical protein